MNQNQTGNDINQGFAAMAGGFKDAGRKRTEEMVAKTGYVAFRNPDAVAQFLADPYYAGWTHIYVDGEYRFFPPHQEEKEDLLDSENNLDSFLQQNIVGNANHIRAHKTDGDPTSIIQNGLFMNSNNLDSTSYWLFHDSLDRLKGQLENWRHGSGHYFIVIEIPQELYVKNETDRIVAITNEPNSSNLWSESGAPFKIPSKYIRGYIDLEKQQFVENGNYAFLPSNPNRNTEIERAKKEMAEGYYFDQDGNVRLMNEMQQPDQQPIYHEPIIPQDPNILETYKAIIKDLTKTTFVSITVLPDDPSKCRYELFVTDKITGQKSKVQEAIVDFKGKFLMETIPSLYNQLAGGIPGIDNEKEGQMVFQSIDGNKTIGLGNLSPEHLQLIRDMKIFVDSQYIKSESEQNHI